MTNGFKTLNCSSSALMDISNARAIKLQVETKKFPREQIKYLSEQLSKAITSLEKNIKNPENKLKITSFTTLYGVLIGLRVSILTNTEYKTKVPKKIVEDSGSLSGEDYGVVPVKTVLQEPARTQRIGGFEHSIQVTNIPDAGANFIIYFTSNRDTQKGVISAFIAAKSNVNPTTDQMGYLSTAINAKISNWRQRFGSEWVDEVLGAIRGGRAKDVRDLLNQALGRDSTFDGNIVNAQQKSTIIRFEGLTGKITMVARGDVQINFKKPFDAKWFGLLFGVNYDLMLLEKAFQTDQGFQIREIDAHKISALIGTEFIVTNKGRELMTFKVGTDVGYLIVKDFKKAQGIILDVFGGLMISAMSQRSYLEASARYQILGPEKGALTVVGSARHYWAHPWKFALEAGTIFQMDTTKQLTDTRSFLTDVSPFATFQLAPFGYSPLTLAVHLQQVITPKRTIIESIKKSYPVVGASVGYTWRRKWGSIQLFGGASIPLGGKDAAVPMNYRLGVKIDY